MVNLTLARQPSKDWVVAIPIFNAIEVAQKSFDYLLASGVDANRIRLLDDGSTDPRWRDLRMRVTKAGGRYDRNENNQGYTANINQAFDREAEFVLLLNSDCLIRRVEIESLVSTLKAYPMLAGVGPLSNHAGSQTVLMAARRSWIDLTIAEIATAIDYISSRLAWRYGQRPHVVPSINGFCTLWRSSAVKAVGGFDAENFARGYGEEDDFCFRLMEAGWFCAVAPWLLAVHFKTQSFSANERNARKPVALATLEKLYGRRFVRSVVDHHVKHPLLHQLAVDAVDI